jgi:hypothetical protein
MEEQKEIRYTSRSNAVETFFFKGAMYTVLDNAGAVLMPDAENDHGHIIYSINMIMPAPGESGGAGEPIEREVLGLKELHMDGRMGRVSGFYETEKEAWDAAAAFLEDVAKAIRARSL